MRRIEMLIRSKEKLEESMPLIKDSANDPQLQISNNEY